MSVWYISLPRIHRSLFLICGASYSQDMSWPDMKSAPGILWSEISGFASFTAITASLFPCRQQMARCQQACKRQNLQQCGGGSCLQTI